MRVQRPTSRWITPARKDLRRAVSRSVLARRKGMSQTLAAAPLLAFSRPSGGSRVDRMTAASPETTGQAEELDLARRATHGDGEAFATLYDRYERRVYNLCLRITGSADDAADATQDSFLKMLE